MTHSDSEILGEVLDRVRRVETRMTNTMRACGMMPTYSPTDVPPKVVFSGETIWVSSPDARLADVSKAAVMAAKSGRNTKFTIMLCNQLWGEMTVRGTKHEE